MFTRNGLRGMLEGSYYRALKIVFLFVAAFIDRSTRDEWTVSQTMDDTRYSEVLNDVTRKEGR